MDAEGPIHEDVLTERLKEINHVERASANVQKNIGRAIRRAVSDGRAQRGPAKYFIWPKAKDLTTFRTPGEEVKRSLELIPDEELELAIFHIIEDQFGMMRDQLPQAVARLLQVDRLHAEGADRLRDLVDRLVDRGLLRLSGPQVYLA